MLFQKYYNKILKVAVWIFEHIGSILIKNEPPLKPINYNTLSIRTAQSTNDIQESIKIHALSFDFPPDKKKIFYLYNYFSKIFFIAEKDKRIVGYCFFKVTPVISRHGFSKKALLFSIGVHPVYRNQKIGTCLMETAISVLKKYNISEIYLDADPSNIAANSLYKQCGFNIVGEVNSGKCYRFKLNLN